MIIKFMLLLLIACIPASSSDDLWIGGSMHDE
jgi:hypothetical protein